MLRVLVTGANRGLGFEFAHRYVERGDRVFAACRRPDAAERLGALRASSPQELTLVSLDVTDRESIRQAHRRVRDETDALDVLINNAGVYSVRGSTEPTERLGALDFDDALTVLRANAVGPLIVAQEFLDLLRAGRRPRIASISSEFGSLTTNTGGFPYYYGASKAALNMVMRSLAADARQSGITTVLLDPGWVRTDMGGPAAPTTPEVAVAGLMRVIDDLTPEHNARFITWEGREQAW
jgi:NAD(P)-dependent dehydrogenase (short-subunit alcohol dehydrogenase family)